MTKANNLIIVEQVLAALFIGCLALLPYVYFSLVRFSATVGFLLLAWGYSQSKELFQMIAALVLAALFQPFAPLSLGRVLWNIVDVVVAIALVFEVLRLRKR
ncbi:MAG: hypothetical protein ROM54_09480 [Anaerobiospirillum sp.]|nr:hypothetical protein [Anaerobiospirillum sp.]